ncbi:MAG: zinc ribbon domain-containing protein [Candidatus Heimdallarchaeota archaeon]|nr:zinc ribbon domain-containing protein [Candidatus Heimdallarchaeota archaeon]
MKCGSCEKELYDNSLFCEFCGAKQAPPVTQAPVKPPIKSQTPPIQQAPMATPVAHSNPGYVPGLQQQSRPTNYVPITPQFQSIPIFPPERNYFKFLGMQILLGIAAVVIFIYWIYTLFFEGNIFSFWLLSLAGLSAMMVSVVSIVYAYYNFNDYKQLNQTTHGFFTDTGIEPIIGVLLMFFFSPAKVFLKYKQLHEHLTTMHRGETKLPQNPFIVLGVIFGPSFLLIFALFSSFDVFIFLYSISGLVYLICYIAYIYFEYQWQEVLNAHIRNHRHFMMSS